MQPSVRERVLCEVMARLGASESLGANAFRAKLDTFEREDLPLYDVEPGEHTVADAGEYSDHSSVTVTLPLTVRAIIDAAIEMNDGPGEQVEIDDSALDPFYVFAVQQLVGVDGNLGGLVDDIAEMSAATVYRPAGRDVIGLEMKFEAKFAVRRGDPTQRG